MTALVIEALAGYPDPLFRRIGHPVTWIGRLIAMLDHSLNRDVDRAVRRRLLGILAVGVIALVPAAAIAIVVRRLPPDPWVLALMAIIASTLLAQRSLHQHVDAVADGLTFGGLPLGRAAVSRIVGRDPETLDEAGVARAAIESLAENFSDGVVAPAFWLAMLGLPGAVAYKAINTADSMIGHRTSRYEAFGWAAARLDDLVNLPASRLSALLIVLAAATTRGASARNALRAIWRDARRHRSPNAGWPEAAMAGALGLKLAGPRSYGGRMVEDAHMGDGRREATAADIRRALTLYRRADGLLIALIALLAVAIIAPW